MTRTEIDQTEPGFYIAVGDNGGELTIVEIVKTQHVNFPRAIRAFGVGTLLFLQCEIKPYKLLRRLYLTDLLDH